jgi:uncharacterized protein with HEPN domain
MRPEDRDAAYLWDMLQAANEITTMFANHDVAEFWEDRILQRALERCLEIIGEAARRMSETCKHNTPLIPWRAIIGQRNILAHEYGQIDHESLLRTATDDIPRLVELLKRALGEFE